MAPEKWSGRPQNHSLHRAPPRNVFASVITSEYVVWGVSAEQRQRRRL